MENDEHKDLSWRFKKISNYKSKKYLEPFWLELAKEKKGVSLLKKKIFNYPTPRVFDLFIPYEKTLSMDKLSEILSEVGIVKDINEAKVLIPEFYGKSFEYNEWGSTINFEKVNNFKGGEKIRIKIDHFYASSGA